MFRFNRLTNIFSIDRWGIGNVTLISSSGNDRNGTEMKSVKKSAKIAIELMKRSETIRNMEHSNSS